ncbi:MAG TPA: ABC transporter permease [Amycolatopsis sp.]|nr:ABC transporter permease [Amycolatopsis sp.]
MLKTLATRIGLSAVLLVLVSFLVFLLIDLAPGDAAVSLAGDNASPERIQEVREQLGLDRALPVRYVDWLAGAVHGNLGTSLSTGEPVSSVLLRTIPPTLSVVVVAVVIAVVVAMAGGTLAALKPGSLFDRLMTILASLGVAVPGFWIALVLASEFAVQRHWLPAIGYTPLADGFGPWLQHVILPSLALAALVAAELMRQLRGTLQDALRSDYVLTARAKGLRANKLVFKHALKNAAVPVITVLGVRFATVLGGTVILEAIFNLQGIGQAMLQAVLARDIPTVLGVTVFVTVVVLLTNIAIEVLHPYFNPKVRKT